MSYGLEVQGASSSSHDEKRWPLYTIASSSVHSVVHVLLHLHAPQNQLCVLKPQDSTGNLSVPKCQRFCVLSEVDGKSRPGTAVTSNIQKACMPLMPQIQGNTSVAFVVLRKIFDILWTCAYMDLRSCRWAFHWRSASRLVV